MAEHDRTPKRFHQSTRPNVGNQSVGLFRPFSSHGCFTSKTNFSTTFGSGSNLALISGNTTSLDSAKMLSMQEDAKSRRISGEVMKRHLYESVITTTRPRRLSVGPHNYSIFGFLPSSCSTHSMPVTPFRGSQEVSPASTPSGNGNGSGGFFRFFSRGTTPKCTTPGEENCTVEEDASHVGLASLFNRNPRHGSISRCRIKEGREADDEGDFCGASSSSAGRCVPP